MLLKTKACIQSKAGGETLYGSTTRFFNTIQGLYKKRPVTASLKTG